MTDRPGRGLSREEPLLTAVIRVDGDDLEDIATALENAAYLLHEEGRTTPVEIIGSVGIVTVRPALDAPYVDWRPDRG
jgi:hypothetical protein